MARQSGRSSTIRPRRAAGRPARPRRATGKPARPRRVLAVDVGNSDITLGWFVGSALDRTWRLASARRSADEIAVTVGALLAAAEAPSPEGAVLCSGVPALVPAWRDALERLAGTPAVEVSAATAKDLPIRYRHPDTLGPDRIANAIAARALYGKPAIVVDLGTATTFDCVSKEGAFLGGAIAPGVGTALEGLLRRAARLDVAELRRPERAMGRATADALRAGIVWGHAGQVDALVRRLALEMRGTPSVIATGGWAALIAPECETVNRVDPALTLKGMRLLWESVR